MNGKTLEKMKYFEGKVCSIVTASMNRSFDEQISREHFVVRVQDVNPDGIWGTHPYNHDMVSYYSMNHIISIHQEIELDPNNPEHAQMIKDYEERTGVTAEPDIHGTPKEKPPEPESSEGSVAFVDIENLEELAESTRRNFEAQSILTK